MSTAHVQRMMVYDTIQPPKLVLRSTSRAAYGSNSRPTYFRRYRTDPEILAQNVHYSGYEHQIPYSNMKGRLVVRAHCESDTEYDYHSRCTAISRHQPHESILDSVSSSTSSLSDEDVDVFEVSPTRPGFVRSPGTTISPVHVVHSTEQHGYLPVAQVPLQHSPYNTVRSSVRYVAMPEVGAHEGAWSSSHTEDRRDGQEILQEGDLNPNYWAENTRYHGTSYEGFPSQYPHNPSARKANTTPTGTVRVNGEIIAATLPKRCAPSPAEKPTAQSAFFGFNPTPRSQRGPSSTGTGTVLRRGLHRHQHRRHSEGDADDFHQYGPIQDECTQCNGEGCGRSLAIKEYLRQMENGDGRVPEVWGPGVRQLVEEIPGWKE